MKKKSKIVYLVIYSIFFTLTACGSKENKKESDETSKEMFKLVPPSHTQIKFQNNIIENEKFNMVDFFYVYNGGGVAVGDLNNDNLPDLFYTGNMVDDALYINQGNLKFQNISASLEGKSKGWSTGVTMIDINHDGFLDIYVCRSGNYEEKQRKNLLYINQGDLTFKEQAELYGLADVGYATQAAFFDYDIDGDLDMYLLNHTNLVRDPNNIKPLISDGSGPANDRLYRNDENLGKGIKFTDVTQQAGIVYDGMGLGLSIADINKDGWPDVFVTNDFVANDYIFINQEDGTFKESAHSLLNHVSQFSMGNDIADFNNDGLFDLITLDMRPEDNFHAKKMTGPLNFNQFEMSLRQGYMPQYMRNTLQVNTGFGNTSGSSFSEIGQLAGVDATDWSWSPLFADFDNDGLKDLFITNGYLRDITDLDFINYTSNLSMNISNRDSLDIILKQMAKKRPSIKSSNYIFKNNGGLNFENATEKWGLDYPSLSNGAAYADLDHDGDLDLVVNTINETALVYENLSNTMSENHFLNVNLKGDNLNTTAIDAEVRLFQSDKDQLLRQSITRGYQSSIDHTLHFGLGKNSKIDSLLVTWPDGSIKKMLNVDADQYITLQKDSGSTVTSEYHQRPDEIFKEVTDKLDLEVHHGETVYYDFNREYLLPHKLSEQGPGIAVGDINNDGFEDFFIGGGYNHSGQLLFGSKNGSFKKRMLTTNEKEKYSEDTGVLFFDFDSDGDLDLYVASGSNEFYENSEFYQDRLYRNDGKGNFKLTKNVLPEMLTSTSCVRAADFDGDRDLDLFIGGRLTPLKYPLPTNSYLLMNQGGKFVDVTNKVAPSLRKPGMITDALWTDYDSDEDLDLIVVGEFMAIEFYKNISGRLMNDSQNTGLSHTSGWWNSINAGDFDNDGDMDYIVGNLGLNSKYKASPKNPISIYAGDYDNNGSIDPILTAYNNEKEYPVHSRDDLIKQVPLFEKKYPDYTSYANATISDILSTQEKSSVYTAKAFELASSILINQGNGKFNIKPLPIWAQIAPIFGIIVDDFDKDGNLDLVVSGNDYGAEVSIGRYDALKGLFLKGTGSGDFVIIKSPESGLSIEGNTRGSASIIANGNTKTLIGINDDSLKSYDFIDEQSNNKILVAPAESIRAKVYLKNGKIRMHEFYYGSSYLSQSTRSIELTGNEKKIIVYDVNNRKKILYKND